jgi:hypothetical protein
MSAYPGAAAMAAGADGGHVTPGRFPPLAPGESGNFLVGRKLIKVLARLDYLRWGFDYSWFG